MKRVLCVVLAMLMLLSLAACGKQNQPPQQVRATEVIYGNKFWTKELNADMNNATVKMHAYKIEAVSELKVKNSDGTENVISAAADKQIVCITANVEAIGVADYNVTHMGAQMTADNYIYYKKRIVLQKQANAEVVMPADLVFYAIVPKSVTPDSCEKLVASVNLHQVSLEDGDDAGINRGIPRRSLQVDLLGTEAQ